jgi:signal transduction histidine kinase
MSTLCLLVIGPDAKFAEAVREILAAQMPDAVSDLLDPAHLRSRPIAAGIVVDARGGAANGAELTARLRAMGFAGAIILVTPPADTVDGAGVLPAAIVMHGAAAVDPTDLATQLVPRIAEQIERSQGEHAEQVMRARRLVAAGEIALRFQHSLNNPLAGILAEAQLMQLDPVPPDQHAALERIVALCRRIIDLGRSLDGMGERK